MKTNVLTWAIAFIGIIELFRLFDGLQIIGGFVVAGIGACLILAGLSAVKAIDWRLPW